MNELNKLYLAMLKSWNGVVKEDGKILFSSSGNEYPIRIDEMDLYLPTSNVLDGQVMDKVFFHPACENITSKETEVFKVIRKMTCMKLLEVFRLIPVVLFTIASGDKPKKAWKQDTIDMMEPLKAAKSPVRKELNSLFARMNIELESDGLDNRFIHFKVSKGGGRSKTTGEKVYYKTKPQFPFYNEMVKRLARSEGQSDNQTVELNNYTVSRAALKLAVHLFQSILPAVLNPDDCEFESHTWVAARLVSYLGCFAEIAEEMNRVQNLFRTDFDKAGVYNIELNWMEHLEDLPDTWRQVPVMDYNSHNTQEEVNNNQSSASLGNMFALTSNNNQNNNNQNNNMGNNQNNNQNNGNNNTNNMMGDFDLSPPPMLNGDRYVRAEIDIPNSRVLHHAISQQGAPVVYHCTRRGNFMQRTEMSGMNGMMMNGMMMQNGMGNMMNNGMMMQNGMPMMNNGMMMQNGMPMMMQPITSGGVAPSIMPDNYGTNDNTISW